MKKAFGALSLVVWMAVAGCAQNESAVGEDHAHSAHDEGHQHAEPAQGQDYRDDHEYYAHIALHREERQNRLLREDGWLTLVGLFWLESGENRFGGDSGNALVLEGDSVPAVGGSLVYDGETVRLRAEPGAGVTVNDEPADDLVLRDDGDGEPDIVALGGLRFHVIERGDRHAIRVKDPDNPARTEFRGLTYFPVDIDYRLRASYVPYDEPRDVPVPTQAGTTEVLQAPGRAEFEIAGARHTLLALDADEGELWFIFKDQTSGKETYGAGRYLYGTLDGDEIDLDFNKSYNPPCVFTPHATCPMPPKENSLAARIEAGEKNYGEH